MQYLLVNEATKTVLGSFNAPKLAAIYALKHGYTETYIDNQDGGRATLRAFIVAQEDAYWMESDDSEFDNLYVDEGMCHTCGNPVGWWSDTDDETGRPTGDFKPYTWWYDWRLCEDCTIEGEG